MAACFVTAKNDQSTAYAALTVGIVYIAAKILDDLLPWNFTTKVRIITEN